MKRITILAILFLACLQIFASPVKDMPMTLVQPNGDSIKVFVSGDEYYRRVCDENGYTLVKNPKTGFIVYANLVDNELIPTNFIAGTENPATLGIAQNLDISIEKKIEKRQNFWKDTPLKEKKRSQTLRTGTINNITIYISFPDAMTFSHSKSSIENLFMNPARGASLLSYYRDISNNQFNIVSSFYPEETTLNVIASFVAPHPRSYYSNAPDNQQAQYEHPLLRDAILSVKPQIEAQLSASDLDSDGDGLVDNITFVIQGSAGAWSTLLWPHQWSLYTQTVSLNGKYVNNYFMTLENHFFDAGNGLQSVLVHEMGHVIDAPDLYRGYVNNITPVGGWDIMASNSVPPQSTSAYILSEYWRLIDDLPVLTQPGTYTVYQNWDRTPGHNVGYIIPSPTSTAGEYYVIDYRKKTGDNFDYEMYLPGEGLIITRINPQYHGYGNIYGGNYNNYGIGDEIYIFRPNAYDDQTNGNLNNAFFSSNSGRTEFSPSSNPRPFLTDNSIDGISISEISSAGGEYMTFKLEYSGFCPNIENLNYSLDGYDLNVTWSIPEMPDSYNIYLNDDFFNIYPGTTTTWSVTLLTAGIYTVKIVPYSSNCASLPVQISNIVVGDYCDWTVITEDSNGDGWNDQRIRVYQYNQLVKEIKNENLDGITGVPETNTTVFPVFVGDVKFSWISASNDNQCNFTVKNSVGQIVYQTNGILPANGVFLEMYNNCQAIQNDVEILSINSLTSGINKAANDTVSVTIRNNGNANQTNIPLILKVNGTIYNEICNQTINADGGTIDYTFAQILDLSAVGTYNIMVSTNLSGDEIMSNNSCSKTVVSAAMPSYSHDAYVSHSGNRFAYVDVDGGSTDDISTDNISINDYEYAEGVMYRLFNNHLFVMYNNGSKTDLGLIGGLGDVTLTSLTYDWNNHILYGYGKNINDIKFYEIDVETLSAVFIAANSSGILSDVNNVEYTSDGFCYGVNVDDNKLYRINPQTAEANAVGTTGFDMLAPYQALSFDRGNERLYSFAYMLENEVQKTKYGYYDLSTGVFNAIADKGAQKFYAYEIIRTEPSSTLNDLSVNSGNLLIYPNPVETELRITNYGLQNTKKIEIYDISGKLLITYHLPHITTIDVSHLSPGVYFLKAIMSDASSQIGKFVKK